MLTRAALKNPYAVFAICMIALILGAVSYQKMRVDIFPEIKLPSILVTTFYRGLSPSAMEGAITLKMEQRFVEASYVEHIESQSLSGMSYIKVFFQPDYGIDAAQSELTSLAYSIIRLLPPGVYPPSVYKFGVSSLPVGYLSISSDTLGPKEIRDLAYFNVRNQIATIPGISFGPPLGGKVRQITVFLDQQRLLARGVSPSEVVNALNAQSAIIPAGNIKIGDLDYYVYSNSLVDVVDKINDIPIKIVNGTPVLIRDIGTAADSAAVQTSIVRVNGREATYLPITRQEGANTLEVTDGIRAKLSNLTEIPSGTTIKFIALHPPGHRQLAEGRPARRRSRRPHDFYFPGKHQSGARRRPGHSPLLDRRAGGPLSDRTNREPDDVGRTRASDRHSAGQQHRGAGKPASALGNGQGRPFGG